MHLLLFRSDVVAAEKDRLRVELELVIVTVLRQHPALRYFQGFHDVCSFPFESLLFRLCDLTRFDLVTTDRIHLAFDIQ